MKTTHRLEARTVLGALRWFLEELGYPPTVRELALELDVAPSTIHRALGELEAAGAIARVPGSPRAIRIITEEEISHER